MNFQRMMEAFDLLNSLNFVQDLSLFIHLEKRRPQGTENLQSLLHSIKTRRKIKFSYEKFGEEELSHRLLEPYTLKGFKNHWYITAKDKKDTLIKSFSLDRLTHLEITNQPYAYPENYKIEQNYRYCFGIISPNDSEPQDLILAFVTMLGKYIKKLPLHETQQIIVDNDKEMKVRQRLCLTHDVFMELLSFGDNLKKLINNTKFQVA